MSRFKRKITFGLLSIFIVSVFAFNRLGDKYFEIAKNLDIFATLFKEVNAYYVDEIDPETLIGTGIEAMLESLDPYTVYIPEDDVEDYRSLTTGQYGGIGALIANINNHTVITMPHVGFPAHMAGLKIGDEIIEIDGGNVENNGSSEIGKLLKGHAGTQVKIKILRFGVDKPIEFNIIRQKITINNVSYKGIISGDIGYIKLSDFTTGAGKEVKEALEELKEKGAGKIILDLRGNPGGLLTEAVNVSNVFISKGSEVVSTKGKRTEWNKTYKALNEPVDINIPIAVLTDGGSASASEITSGVLQDYDRAVLIGRKTFGKGLVQATRPLSYNSQVKITTAKYYIPSGRCIQAINYRVRNDDGSFGNTPDSLIAEFKTKGGRLVYDGGGLDPDFVVDQTIYAAITFSLIQRGLIFDHATRYYYNNPEIKPANQFNLTENEYNEFIHWLKDKDYDYVTSVESKLEDLANTANESKYYTWLQDQIESIKSKISHDKEDNLVKFREEIQRLLEAEISSRYYLVPGQIESSLRYDDDVNNAVKVLNDKLLYSRVFAVK